MARPGQIRTTVIIQGRKLIQGNDGHAGWTLDVARSRAPRALSPETARNVAAGADFDGPLVDYAAKGNSISFAGMDTAEGRPAYKLRVKLANGLVDSYFIDAKTYMQTKWEGDRTTADGSPITYVSYFRDYRPIEGVMWAHRIDSGTKGEPATQHIVTETVRFNVAEPRRRGSRCRIHFVQIRIAPRDIGPEILTAGISSNDR